MSVGRLASVSFGPLQMACDVFVLAAFFFELILHLHVPAAEDWCLFLFCKLHVWIVFHVANDVWISRINVDRILCSLHLSSSCCFCLRFFLFLLLLYLQELLKRALQRNLAPPPLLRHRLGALLQQVECSSLLFCTQTKMILVFWMKAEALTGNERHGVEGIPPLIRNFDRFSDLGVIWHGVSLLICMSDNFLHIKWVQRVKNIEEIFTVRYASFGQLLWEVLHELDVFLRHRPDFDH